MGSTDADVAPTCEIVFEGGYLLVVGLVYVGHDMDGLCFNNL